MTTEMKPKAAMPIADQIAGIMQTIPRITAGFDYEKAIGKENPGERDEILTRLNAILRTLTLVRDNEKKIKDALAKK